MGVRSGGGGLSGRFNFSRKARCAFREGDGPRTFGFSIASNIAHAGPSAGISLG
jgi:hypothetical protein